MNVFISKAPSARAFLGLFGVALGLSLSIPPTAPAAAATIDYTLTGQASYQIQGNNTAGTFTFSWVGDTSNVLTSGGESRIYSLPGTITLTPYSVSPSNPIYNGSFQSLTQLVLDSTNGIAFGFQDVGEPQGNPSNYVAVFQLSDSLFTSIALNADFSVTTAIANALFGYYMPVTNAGVFSGYLLIGTLDSAVTFSANVVNATPLPAALPLFATGLGALGLFGWRRKRKAAALAAA
jgi:hypothetical protein